jgi:hypothetical protein
MQAAGRQFGVAAGRWPALEALTQRAQRKAEDAEEKQETNRNEKVIANYYLQWSRLDLIRDDRTLRSAVSARVIAKVYEVDLFECPWCKAADARRCADLTKGSERER